MKHNNDSNNSIRIFDLNVSMQCGRPVYVTMGLELVQCKYRSPGAREGRDFGKDYWIDYGRKLNHTALYYITGEGWRGEGRGLGKAWNETLPRHLLSQLSLILPPVDHIKLNKASRADDLRKSPQTKIEKARRDGIKWGMRLEVRKRIHAHTR